VVLGPLHANSPLAIPFSRKPQPEKNAEAEKRSEYEISFEKGFL